MIFQYVVVTGLCAFCAYVLFFQRDAAGRRLAIGALVGVMIVFVIRPDWSYRVGRLFGIGRGVDFLFYVSHLTLFFVAFVYYLKFREVDARLTRLVRAMALEHAGPPPPEGGSKASVARGS